jgi:hypothetical protein
MRALLSISDRPHLAIQDLCRRTAKTEIVKVDWFLDGGEIRDLSDS